MIPVPEKAFLLAAGMGTRLRPHTDHQPKPMVPVAGRPILDYALDRLAGVGVKEVWINLHYLPGVIRSHLSDKNSPVIHFSEEKTLLDTGKGVETCLKSLGNDPFFLINGDALWENGQKDALLRLCETYDPDQYDILLLLQPLSAMTLTRGTGDYDLIAGQPRRNKDKQGQYMFTGIRLVNPKCFEYNIKKGETYSFLALMDEAEKRGRLQALVHDGAWHHISTPEDLAALDRAWRKTP